MDLQCIAERFSMNRAQLKSAVKSVLPRRALKYYRYIYNYITEIADSKKDIEHVFSKIYENNKWGGDAGRLDSGSGSVDAVAEPYFEMLKAQSISEGFNGLTFVDLGCGDFRVGRKLLPLCREYIGVDIVKAVVESNAKLFGGEAVKFIHMNIVDDDLPDGDVCMIRQVLQHLSNQQILRVLSKIDKYKWVFITEHYPDDGESIIENLDKTHGSGTRVYKKSGVYLSYPPFNLPADGLEQVLEVRASANGKGDEAGVVRTFLYRPAASLIPGGSRASRATFG